MFKKSALILICLLLTMLSASAQSMAVVNISEGGNALLKTNIGVDYDHGWGTMKDGFSARVSYRFFRDRKFTVTANARYASTQLSMTPGDLNHGFDPDAIRLNGTHVFGQTGFTSTFRSTLLGKPLFAIGLVNAEWGQGGFARVSGIAMGLIMLKTTRTTQFGLGPLAMINTSSRIPIFPVFMYRHVINEKWCVNLSGATFGFDYTPTPSDMINLGADINVKSFYFKPGDKSLPTKCRFTSTSFRPMVNYRRRLAPNLYFYLRSGVSLKMSCRINGVTGTERYVECRQKPAPFIQTGASYTL